MATGDYEDWAQRRSAPGFRRAFALRPTDTVELPAMLVSEGEAAAETIRRHIASQRRGWVQRKLA